MKETLTKIKKAIKGAQTALLASHVDPDGDSIGSMLATGMILSQFGVEVDYYSKDGVPRIYRFLQESGKVKKKITANKRYDLLITLDSSDIKRVGGDLPETGLAKLVINIDHHPDNTKFADINFVEKSSSTAELVYYLAKSLKAKIALAVAECLYVAIITDTGNFRYENTSANTLAIAEDLLKAGVSPPEITTRIYDTKSVASIRVQAAALSSLEISPERNVAWATATKEMMEKNHAKAEDLVGLVDQIRSIDGIEVAILFREEDGKVKVNFRSKSKINVSEIARVFGGGGHMRAAGVIFENKAIEQAKDEVIKEVLKRIKASKYLV
ncbi:MAG: bifunctional oligoribonuclease/PAP phosphatase NrnA [Candidatus Margulisbacteria bacterium]|nr:bifunctional oligoribonuclease/PAP phosphatase NrnA [Candidatus Margulisiibacteriota bacterium]